MRIKWSFYEFCSDIDRYFTRKFYILILRMSNLEKIAELGKELGYQGADLAKFITEQQAAEREARAEEREKMKEEKEKVKEEREKLELEVRLATIKKGESDDSAGSGASTWGAWSTKLIPQFDENDVGKFFIAFERVATQLNWERESWAIIVQSAFKGRAQLAYSALSDGDSADYTKVKKVVLAAYELIPEAYRLKFRNYVKEDKDSFVEFIRNKCIMFDDWLRAAKIDSMESLKSAILLEDFKNGLPASIRSHLDEFNITSVEEAAQAADRYVLSHNMSYKGGWWKPSLNFKNKLGQGFKFRNNRYETRQEQGKDKLTSLRNVEGKSITESNQSERNKQVVCYGCHKTGHIKSRCPNSKGKVSMISNDGKWNWNSSIREKLLEDYGDFVIEGKIRTSIDEEEEQEVVMLRDTGATQSCVLRSSLPTTFQCRKNNFVLLGGFPNTVVSCPLVELHLESTQYTGVFRFAIVEALPVLGVQAVISNDIAGKEMPSGAIKYSGIPTDSVEVVSSPVSVVTRSQHKERKVETSEEDAVDLDNLPEWQSQEEKKKPVIDALCSFSELKEQQRADPTLVTCFEEAVNFEGNIQDMDLSKPVFVLDNDALYRLSRPATKARDDSWMIAKQLVIPQKYRDLILNEAHEGTWGGQ